ncbi:MAG TPA: hypothetical protein PKL28_04395 [Rhodocyclaceae bacterium]|jgi:hypothetical protein|nr:hypothetical protein [Rhodocyclaceae bacterium]HMZ55452.1 hypothetical protein [Nitrospira sp.]HNM80268.1 hypothetical protein [Rhodocyclaceae bacterium]
MDHKRAMSSHLIIAALAATLSLNAWADIYKCKTPSGKTIISDTGCKDNSAAVAVHSSESLTQQQRIDAEAVQRRNKAQLETLENENTAWRNQPSPPSPVSPVAAGNTTAMDEEAIRQCVRDVERQGMSERKKAELITACRTAGSSQRASGTDEDAVRNCVRRVERTGASGAVKARQIALCHGGDVPPEPVVVATPPSTPSTITSCDRGGCWDSAGNRYNGTGGTMARQDGKSCQKIGAMMHCN